jgi:hypothetical protein
MALTPPRPVDIVAVFPELAGQERPAVRLHPRRGRPSPRDSSVGGPLLWPVAEPWPRCDDAGRHATPAPMVAVAQMFASDVAGLPCPGSTDICQVLWCPALHEPHFIPHVRVRWRASAGVRGDLAAAPQSDPGTAIDNFIPKPCSVLPEQTVDYPDWWELSEELRQRIEAWQRDSGWIYAYHLGAAPGTKAGGWPYWIQDPEWPTCPRGHAMDHLLTVASWEYHSESRRTWLPPGLPTEDGDAGLMLGDAGNMYLFTCVTCDDRPVASVMQSS